MNGLEAITNIRKGTSHNHRHRIVDVRGLHLFLNVDFYNSVVVECLIHYFLLIYLFTSLPFYFFYDFAFKAIFKPADAFLYFY